ncbi:MAG: DUF3048 domain-containing protein [Thermaerobacter sp.]|nr:DUF3048 domain-containing protein [Thermaerobacter sp.]
MTARLKPLLLLSVALLAAGCGSAQSVSPAVHQKTQSTQEAPRKKPIAPVRTIGSAVAVTIDNAPGAWPQSGLTHADLVFEFPAEGGITRYLAVYWHQPAVKIGPVRSTRIYFDNVVAAYGWPLGHAGGNVDALHAIGPLGIKNIDQIYGSGAYFWRTSDRPMPHNLYTSTKLLELAVKADGYTPAAIPAFATGKFSGQRTSSAVITYADYPNSWVYDVGWSWNGKAWSRLIDGKAVSTQAGNAVFAENVAIIYAAEFPDPDPYTVGAVNFTLTSGSGWLLENAQRTAITWTFGPGGFRFYSAGGSPAPFQPGQTWVEVLPTGTRLSYTP